MDKKSRALRRHHRDRLKKRARSRIKINNWPTTQEHIEWMVCRAWNTQKIVQCYCCCNERRNIFLTQRERLTIQERRAYDDSILQLQIMGDYYEEDSNWDGSSDV